MAVEIKIEGASLVELKKSLIEIRNELGMATDPKKMEELARSAGQVKDRINEINEQIAVFAGGSQFEQAGTALGQIKGSLANLDFSGAAQQAKQLSSIVKGISFQSATAGLKDLGSTFLQLGKALWGNPLFLLAAVIIAIVAAIVKLLDKIGVLKVITKKLGQIFELLMIPINAIIEGLKKFTDWLGITNNAAEESAQRQADAAEKTAKAYEEKSEGIIQGIDQEIRMNELSGKSTEDLERKKVYLIMKTAQARARADREAYEAALIKGELDQEEIANLKEKARASRLAYEGSINDVKYFEASLKKEKDDARKKEKEAQDKADKEAADKAKTAREKAIAAQKEYNAMRLSVNRQLQDLELELMDEGVDKELKANEIKYQRLIEDTRKNEKLLASEKEKIISQYQKLASDKEAEIIKNNNEKILAQEVANTEERLALQNRLSEDEIKLQQLNANKFIDNEKLSFDERKKNVEELEKILTEIERSILNNRLSQLEQQRLKEQEVLKKKLDDNLISQEEYNQRSKDLDLAFNTEREIATQESEQNITKITEDAAETRKKISDDEKKKRKEDLQETLQSLDSIVNAFKSIRGEGNQLGVDLLTNGLSAIKQFTELANMEFENASQKAAAYAAAIGGVISGIVTALSDSAKQKSEDAIATAESNYAAEQKILEDKLEAGLISQEEYDNSLKDLEKSKNNEMDKLKRKAFEDDKKARIAQATIAGLMGAVQAFTSAMVLPAPYGAIVGAILAAAVTALTATNISKIKAQQYQSTTSGGGGSTSTSVNGGDLGTNSSAVPSFNLFGQGNNANTTNASPQVMGGNQQTPIVKAIVVESDITSAQNNVARYSESATL